MNFLYNHWQTIDAGWGFLWKIFAYKWSDISSYTDGNPSEPGRICAALLCGLCHGHGDCVHDINTKNITCACIEGYTGKFCEIAPSKASLILPLILALIFLLLTLCCCLYFCLKTKLVPNSSYNDQHWWNCLIFKLLNF